MTKTTKLFLIILVVLLVLSVALFVACKPRKPSNTTKPNEPTECTVVFDANGGYFENGFSTQTIKVLSNSKIATPNTPTRIDHSFSGWSKSKNGGSRWVFDSDKVTEDTTLYAQWELKSASIFSMDNATIEGTTIYLYGEPDAQTISLNELNVVCSTGATWSLYQDILGSTEIKTKIVPLTDEIKIYYIVVYSNDNTQQTTYNLKVQRSHQVDVVYYNCNDDSEPTVVLTSKTYTGKATFNLLKPQYYANFIKGYTLLHWVDDEGNVYDDFNNKIELRGPLNLYAVSKANQYTVTLDANGGELYGNKNITVTYDKEFSIRNIPTRDDYIFVGWSEYKTFGCLTDSDGIGKSPWHIDKDVTLYAVWQGVNYLLTVDSDNPYAGTVSKSGEHRYGNSVTVVARPNIGYIFLGWYEGDNKVSADAEYQFTMGHDKQLTAHWTTNKTKTEVNDRLAGTVTNLDGGYVLGQQVQLQATTNPGYIWMGWFNGDEKLTDEQNYTITITEDQITYTAKWITTKNKIEIYPVGAGSVTVFDEAYTLGQEIVITATTNPGYTFVGWYKDDELISSDLQCTIKLTADDMTYIAKWSKVTLTVNNDSAGSVQQLTGKYKVGDKAQIAAMTNRGYTFVGWYKGDELVSSDLQCTIKLTADDVTYIAKWSKVTLTVNNGNAGSVQQLTDKYKVGDEVQIAAMTNPGYTFVGWFNDGGQVSTDLQCEITMTGEDVTYTATWKAIEYDITFSYENNIGEFVGEKPTKYTADGLLLPQVQSPDKTHYAKWQAADGTIYTDSIPQGTTGNLALTVIWSGKHTWDAYGKCTVCKVDCPYDLTDGKITFGSYPQRKVEDTALQSMLNAEMGNKLPSSEDSNGWTDYGYYINGIVQSYMWYIDIEYKDAKYRGVYFTSYRTEYADGNSSGYQNKNGYQTYTVYWFKWEPITWRILSQENGVALIMADIILDSQCYYHISYDTRIIDGKTINPANYKESDIRKWLNNNFYNVAFDSPSKGIILQTEVDNSTSTTGCDENQGACENTFDNVFLLSYKDVTNTDYGFMSDDHTDDPARMLQTSDYAQCQGAVKSYWLLRSPMGPAGFSYITYVCDRGNLIYNDRVSRTSLCVVPALQIIL